MNAESILEIFLHPEEFFWGEGETRIKTILGSCIAISMWHPILKIGGLSHSLLPTRRKEEDNYPYPHPRYVDEAVTIFLTEIRKGGAAPADFKVKIFGGARVIGGVDPDVAVGTQNLATSRRVLEENGFFVFSEHAGGHDARNIMLDLWSGETWLRKIPRT